MANKVQPYDTSTIGLANQQVTSPKKPPLPTSSASTISSSDNFPLSPPPPTHFSTIPPQPIDDSASPLVSNPVTPQTKTSTLESQAQLSLARSILDKTARVFWWTASLPGLTTKAALNMGIDKATAIIIQQVAQKGISLTGSSAPETPLKKLRDCLFEMHQKINASIPIDAPLKQRTINALETFLTDHQKHLADCYSPSAWYFPERLNMQQHVQFITLLTALKENQSMVGEGRFLQPLCELLETYCQYQKISHQNKLAAQIVGKAMSSTPTPTAPIIDAPDKTQKNYVRIPPAIATPVHPNLVPFIIHEFEQLKSLGFRNLLALFFLPEGAIQKKVENRGNIENLIKRSSNTLDSIKSPNELFQDLIYTEIDNSNLNYFQKMWQKMTCWALAPTVLFIVEHILDQSRDVVLYLIGLSPEQRLDLVVKMGIESGRGFIGWLQSQYRTIAETKNLSGTVEEAVSSAINNIKIKDKHGTDLTSKDLIHRLVGSLLDRYAPSLNWSKTGAAHFEQRAQDSKSPFFSLWFMSLSYICRAINILIIPWRWCLNAIIRKALTWIAASQIHAKFSDKDGASLDFGKLALNSIYKALYEKLQKINRSPPGAETEDHRRASDLHQRGFVEKSVQNSINKLVADFLELLYIQGSNVNELSAQLSPANAPEQIKKGVMATAFAPGIQKATEEIIHSLQIFLEDHTFSAAFLELLKGIHHQWLRSNTSDTEKGLARLEKDFYVELKDAVNNGIQIILDNKLDPLKHIQNEADLFIDGLKDDAKSFGDYFASLQNLSLMSLKTLKQKRDLYLNDNIRRRREKAIKATKETTLSTQSRIKTTSDRFYALSQPICSNIDELFGLANKREQIENLNEDLKQLMAPLDSAISTRSTSLSYSPLQLTLQRIITKNYPERVQSLISTLRKNFETWRTETLKRDNQALINGTITTLKKALETAIADNTQKADALSAEITLKAQSSFKLTATLLTWTGNLTYFICVSDKAKINPFQNFITSLGTEALPSLILSKIDDFVFFLGKNHHIKGIFSFIIKAYLELPRRSPKEFKKIIDSIKQRSEDPAAPPRSLGVGQ
ncbi:MAG TPA: hypothetical protein VHK67_06345 [Rhabdochlamydiaceae bacterium]|jgi:hypothetical protein|nr:hypothetical protein [Rhabdochlamydiaceae bacterium]